MLVFGITCIVLAAYLLFGIVGAKAIVALALLIVGSVIVIDKV